jgi:hypothetical protein
MGDRSYCIFVSTNQRQLARYRRYLAEDCVPFIEDGLMNLNRTKGPVRLSAVLVPARLTARNRLTQQSRNVRNRLLIESVCRQSEWTFLV